MKRREGKRRGGKARNGKEEECLTTFKDLPLIFLQSKSEDEAVTLPALLSPIDSYGVFTATLHESSRCGSKGVTSATPRISEKKQIT